MFFTGLGDMVHYLKNLFKGNQFKTIKLGFWPGGDRDGNPFVTTEIT
jgi:phosphoenolpyruvate carboxylase